MNNFISYKGYDCGKTNLISVDEKDYPLLKILHGISILIKA